MLDGPMNDQMRDNSLWAWTEGQTPLDLRLGPEAFCTSMRH
jgi:hypothetical protein